MLNKIKEDAKKQGIFLMFTGLSKTVVESQVIAHCKAMRNNGINIEIWSFCTSKRAYNEACKIINDFRCYGVKIRLFKGITPAVLFSEFMHAILLAILIKRFNYNFGFIHCRTDYSAVVAGILKIFMKFKLIWDSRGDRESEFYMYDRYHNRLKMMLSYLFILRIRLWIYIANKIADSAIFVSDALKRKHLKNRAIPTETIPCVADDNLFFFDSALRMNMRDELGYSEQDIILIYAGSLKQWQCINETLSLIEEHVSGDNNHKAIIISPNATILYKHIKNNLTTKILLKSAAMKEVNAYLNAADYAIFIRDKNPVNRVASPVKFSEYCLAGLPIIMTDAVEQSHYYAKIIGNLVLYRVGAKIEIDDIYSNKKRDEIFRNAKRLLSRSVNTDKYAYLYGLTN